MNKKIIMSISVIAILAITILVVKFVYFNSDSNEYYPPKPLEGSLYLNPEADIYQNNLAGSGYSIYKDKVYYDDNLVNDADFLSFVKSGDYAKDKNKVFYKGILIENADAATFKKVRTNYDHDIFADKNKGYYNGNIITLSETDALLKFLSKGIGGEDLGNNYRKYKDEIYYWDNGGGQAAGGMVFINADVKTFVSINDKYCQWDRKKDRFYTCNNYGKDDKKVFHSWFVIEDADPNTFQILKGNFSKDKNYVFYGSVKIEGIDSETFQTLGIGAFGKDKKSVVYGDKIINNADPETFEVLHEKYCLAYANALAKDKNNYYLKENIITESQYYENLKSEAEEIKPIIDTCI